MNNDTESLTVLRAEKIKAKNPVDKKAIEKIHKSGNSQPERNRDFSG